MSKVEYPFATAEQRELADQARIILEKELAPRIEELEQGDGGKGHFPVEVAKVLGEAGYLGITIPEEYGGLGLDCVTRCLIEEEMAKVDAGFAFAIHGASNLQFPYIAKSGLPKEEKQAWADRIMSGESFGAICFTESMAGSDASAIKTTAVFDETTQEWVLNGVKCFASNGPIADHFVVFAWTDKEKKPSAGISSFFVEKERGVQIGTIENKLGLKMSKTSEVVLEDVRVPADHLCGELGTGYKQFLSGMDEVRVTGMVFSLGIAQAAVDAAVTYAKSRQTMGKPIIQHQGLGFLLAEMQTRTDASRAILYEGARCLDEGLPLGTISSSSKNFVANSTVQTVIDAMEVFGGYGYMKDYPVEKLVRDAKIFTIFDGTTEINKMVIARLLDKKYV